MVSFISKFLFTATVTAPTFLSLGLIGVIKDSTNYFQLWDDMLENKIFPTSFEWWGINISFGFMLICLIGIKIFLYNNYNLLCSIWGYRYYEVYTEENTYILISGKCIRNKNEIKKFIEVTDYMGLIINEK